MVEFLQQLIRFVEPLITGIFALVIIGWTWSSFQPGLVRTLLEQYGSRRVPRAAIVGGFAVVTVLGSAAEQSSQALATCWHDSIITEAYKESGDHLGLTDVCGGTLLHASPKDGLRDYYGTLHRTPAGDRNDTMIEGLVTARTYFESNIVGSAFLIVALGLIANFLALIRALIRRLRYRTRIFTAMVGLALLGGACLTGYWHAEQAYHRSVRYAVLATVLARPEICKGLVNSTGTYGEPTEAEGSASAYNGFRLAPGSLKLALPLLAHDHEPPTRLLREPGFHFPPAKR